MPNKFSIKKRDGSIFMENSVKEKELASLKIKEWETNFFKRKFGALSIIHTAFERLSYEATKDSLDFILTYADNLQFDVIELHLNILGLNLVPILEEKGFRLVDSRITFITMMHKQHIIKYSCPIGKIHLATKSELSDILYLTHEALTDNRSFFSRFKNRKYFSKKETEKYFSAWIENHIDDSNTFFAVVKKENKTIGYYIYKRAGLHKGGQIYKGILTAVATEFRGYNLQHSMQSFLYDFFPEEKFYLDNTTQLTNFTLVKHHIRTQKNPVRIEMTFYRSKDSLTYD
jgi:hypothetical protein